MLPASVMVSVCAQTGAMLESPPVVLKGPMLVSAPCVASPVQRKATEPVGFAISPFSRTSPLPRLSTVISGVVSSEVVMLVLLGSGKSTVGPTKLMLCSVMAFKTTSRSVRLVSVNDGIHSWLYTLKLTSPTKFTTRRRPGRLFTMSPKATLSALTTQFCRSFLRPT